MVDYVALQQERDSNLVTEFWVSCKNLRKSYEDWIQSEVNDCLYRLQCLEPTLPDILRPKAQSDIRRMFDINQTELPEAVRNMDEKIADVRTGAYNNVRDARDFLEEGMRRFDMMVYELMNIRRFLQSYDGDNKPVKNSEDDYFDSEGDYSN